MVAALALACTVSAGAQVLWTGGTNDIYGTDSYGTLNISGGTNTIFGQEGIPPPPPVPSLTITGGLEFSGTTGGVLRIRSDADAPGTLFLNANLTFSGTAGTAEIRNDTVHGFGTTFAGVVNLGGATRTFAINNGSNINDMLISAQITNGALTKTNTGTLTLSGANSYAGTTTLSAGTLLANNVSGSATGSGSVTVATGATLGGNGFIVNGSNAITLNSGSTIAPGNNAIGKLTTNDQTWNGGSTYIWELNSFSNGGNPNTNAGTGWDLIDMGTGVLRIDASLANRVTVQAVQGNIFSSNGEIVINEWFTIAKAGSVLDVQGVTGPANSQIAVGSDIAALFVLPTTPLGEVFEIQLAGTSGDYSLQVRVTPEPGSLMLVGCTAGILLRRRRQVLR